MKTPTTSPRANFSFFSRLFVGIDDFLDDLLYLSKLKGKSKFSY